MILKKWHRPYSNANRQSKTSAVDTPQHCPFGEEYWYNYPVQDFDYRYNSWAFRSDEEYEQYCGKPVNICVGDSSTNNIGGPIQSAWPNQLAQQFSIPTLNLGVGFFGNDAIKQVYEQACTVFDVQNTFVMYSDLNRRTHNGELFMDNHAHEENTEYFVQQRITNAYECALPYWNYSQQEQKLLDSLGIYYFKQPIDYASNRHWVDLVRETAIDETRYDLQRGGDWPTYEEFIAGAEPHLDMLTDQFGEFLDHWQLYKMHANRDGHHMNSACHKIYADYLWKLYNES